MHGGPYEAHDLMMPIAQELEVVVNEQASIRGICSLVNWGLGRVVNHDW
jgi:hypothetical protein